MRITSPEARMTTKIWAQDRRQLVLDGEGVEVEMVEGEKRQRVLYTYVLAWTCTEQGRVRVEKGK